MNPTFVGDDPAGVLPHADELMRVFVRFFEHAVRCVAMREILGGRTTPQAFARSLTDATRELSVLADELQAFATRAAALGVDAPPPRDKYTEAEALELLLYFYPEGTVIRIEPPQQHESLQ
jgi:hypothetical protein